MRRNDLANLQKVLAALYDDEHSIRRIVQDAGLTAAAMRIDAHALNSWHSVLSEAQKHHQVEHLLRTVAAEYPNNRPLHEASAAYQQATGGNVAPSPRRWQPALLTTLLLLSIGSGWYWNVYGFKPNIAVATPLVAASPTATTARSPRTPTATPTTTATASPTPMPTAVAPAPSPATTIAEPAGAPLTGSITATLAASTTLALQVFDEGLTESTYLIKGADTALVALGADLVVYHEPNPGTEVAIALLKVIGKNPTSLTAQAILIDPKTSIRTNLRVDGNLGFLSTSQLVPVFDYAVGYLFSAGRVRLRPDHGLTLGDQLQALAFERIGGEIIDALPTDTMMQITAIGTSNIVAAVELLTGTWPVTGTIVGVVEGPEVVESPTATITLTTSPIPDPTATVTPAPGASKPKPTQVEITVKNGTSNSLKLSAPPKLD